MLGLLETARARRAVIAAEAELSELSEAANSGSVSDAESYYDAREELANLRADAAERALHAIVEHGDGVGTLVFAEIALGRHDDRLEAIIARAAREVSA